MSVGLEGWLNLFFIGISRNWKEGIGLILKEGYLNFGWGEGRFNFYFGKGIGGQGHFHLA